ncbi:MAG: Unknown protein [uncultured Thiotrichaceae bacterium]|uniref:Uncharacterized protein n=1 Tax=uncultured Thiotrichaceae bacterium TaxID=298394 RepID=A0A6S6U2F9_9GAMM|nr:MAG: Unknown protein [uncultured Thiotrichaceae bacterium]
MTQLIKIKRMHSYAVQLTVTAFCILLCSYILSVHAGEQRSVDTSFATPAELSVLSKPSFGKVISANGKSLQLDINLSKKLLIADSAIKWQIQRSGKTIRELKGSHYSVKLPGGLYKVRLQVGKYQAEKQVMLQAGQKIQPYFQVDIGRLQVSADHPVDWEIKGPGNRVYRINDKQSVNEILPVGRYQVKAILPALAQEQVIDVQSGQYVMQHLAMPLGKVNLMAIRNNQPLLQAMKWEVFRLEKNNRHKIGEYHLHFESINVPPGQYEAVARHQDKTSKRRFWVQKETTNRVVLVME